MHLWKKSLRKDQLVLEDGQGAWEIDKRAFRSAGGGLDGITIDSGFGT